MRTNPREEIQKKLKEGDLRWLLLKTGELHGHFCPFVALGVKASVIALKRLGTFTEGINEEMVAIVEVNNCFVDGVQMVTGCTLGNNALIYKDLGKNAVTLTRRNGKGIRVAVLPEYPQRMSEAVPEAKEMFDRFILRRETGTKEEMKRFKEVWEILSFKQLEIPNEKQFKVEEVSVNLPGQAPILPSAICSRCGEAVMETRARIKGGKIVCIACAQDDHFILEGRGMRIERGHV